MGNKGFLGLSVRVENSVSLNFRIENNYSQTSRYNFLQKGRQKITRSDNTINYKIISLSLLQPAKLRSRLNLPDLHHIHTLSHDILKHYKLN